MSDDFLPYGRQQISDEDVEAVIAALRSPLITQGPRIAEFERACAEYLGAAEAVAFCSGTAALHAAAIAARLEPGQEVITSPTTFAASANCALYVGARPSFCDIDPATWNLDTVSAAKAVGPQTGAVIAVSFAGLPVDLEPLNAVRGRITVIEDACHALGARRDGVAVGGPGGADMTTFSFHPVKAMTTGEGGLVTTERPELAERLRVARTHGITREGLEPGAGGWQYEMRFLGFNYRITDFQCALGLSQLSRLDGWIGRRNEIARRYRERLGDDERVELPPQPKRPGWTHAYHLFVVRLRDGEPVRRHVFDRLRSASIGVQVHYIPVYRLSYYRDTLGYAQDTCPEAERLYTGSISLPMFPAMSDEDVDRVVRELQGALSDAPAGAR